MPAMTPAIKALYDKLECDFDSESLNLQAMIYKREFMVHSNDAMPEKVAYGFSAYLDEKNVRVADYDILAGNLQYPDVEGNLPIKYIADRSVRPRKNPYGGGLEVMHGYNEAIFSMPEKVLNEHEIQALDATTRGCDCGVFARCHYGHMITGFDNVLREGFGKIEQKISARLNDSVLRDDEISHLKGMLTVVQACRRYFSRYADGAAQTASQTADEAKRKNLKRIERALRNLESEPAANFFEAVQTVILMQELATMETPSGSLSLGRLDQLFYPFYEREARKNAISYDEAQEIIDAFRLKLAALVNSFQNVTVCGIDEHGKFAGNDVSLMFIRSARNIRVDQPLLSLRYVKDMPEEYWLEALRLIELGDGFPAIFNDDVVIASKLRVGVSKEDAWNYGIVGCVEPSIGGKEFSNTEEMRLSWLKVLEFMLNGGVCRVTGERFPLKEMRNLDDVKSFEEFYAWYKSELLFYLEMSIDACNLIDAAVPKAHPMPFLSFTMDGCIENADDASARGTVYNLSSINSCGMSNAVDSLMAIKELVFTKGIVSLSELNAALNKNFEGYEILRAYALNRCPKFGNDLPEPDEMMRELVHLVTGAILCAENSRGGKFQAGMYSVAAHGHMGKCTGASPDGRFEGVALANAMSPVQGADTVGPTAVVNSVTGFDHTAFGNGMVLDFKFNPSFFRDEERKRSFRAMVDAYFEKGGMEIQFNVIGRDTLLAAQKEPDAYRNLLVRVSGFSAYFVMLDKVLQDEIIARTEYENLGAS